MNYMSPVLLSHAQRLRVSYRRDIPSMLELMMVHRFDYVEDDRAKVVDCTLSTILTCICVT